MAKEKTLRTPSLFSNKGIGKSRSQRLVSTTSTYHILLISVLTLAFIVPLIFVSYSSTLMKRIAVKSDHSYSSNVKETKQWYQQQLSQHPIQKPTKTNTDKRDNRTGWQLLNTTDTPDVGEHSNVNYHNYHREPQPRPTLSTIVQGWNITGDPSWLLNYAIVGFPKSGTSSIMYHLRSHPEVSIFKDERCELAYNQQARLIEDLYRQFPAGDRVRAIKCPIDLESTRLSMRNYQKYFHQTDFIVGIRHPVLWFESFYNFRIHNGYVMPPAEKLIGKCKRGWNNVCTFRSNFHIFLSNLGKTNLSLSPISSDPRELQYVDIKYQSSAYLDPVPTNRRIFLYEVSQLSDSNKIREQRFLHDLQHFLHLRTPLSPVVWFKPGKNQTSNDRQQPVQDQQQDEQYHRQESQLALQNTQQTEKINICDDKFQKIRSVLMVQATNASRWIRKYFIRSKDVVVSSQEYFASSLMKTWEYDPCNLRNKTSDLS